MGGRLYLCELIEAYWRGVAKPGIFFGNRTEKKNNQHEKFSKTENLQHATRTNTRNSQKRENVRIHKIRKQQTKLRKTRIAKKKLCVLLCFINLISGNCYGPGVIPSIRGPGVTGLNLLHKTKFQRFLSGKSVFLNSIFQIREFHAH